MTIALKWKHQTPRDAKETCAHDQVKCDERPGLCQNCERVVLECRWPEVKSVVAGVKRERADSVLGAEDGESAGLAGPEAMGPEENHATRECSSS